MHIDEFQKRVSGKIIKKVHFKYGMSGHDTWIDKIEFNDGSFLSFKIVPYSWMRWYSSFQNWGIVEDGLRIFGKLTKGKI